MINLDYEDAMVGQEMPSPERAKIVVRKVLGAIDQVNSKADLQHLCRVVHQAASTLTQASAYNVNIAAQAGSLPTRYLGIDSEPQVAAGILAGGILGVTANPTVAVRIVAFRTDDTFAADFQVDNIRVATIDLIVGDRACPATMFTTGICLPPTSAPILPAGSAAITNVTNIGGAARRFRGGFGVLKLTNPEC